jgi:hypothetical protein
MLLFPASRHPLWGRPPPLTYVGGMVEQRQQHRRHMLVLHGRHSQPGDEMRHGRYEATVQAGQGASVLPGALADGGPHL